MSHKELVARLRDCSRDADDSWVYWLVDADDVREAADAIEALEQREAWWRELHSYVGHWYGEAGSINAVRERVERVAELRRLLGDPS